MMLNAAPFGGHRSVVGRLIRLFSTSPFERPLCDHASALVIAALMSVGATVAHADGPSIRSPDFRAALRRAAPFIVGVYGTPIADEAQRESVIGSARKAGSSRAPGRPETQVGAGFFIARDGLIATAAHVVERCETVVVRLADGSVRPATVIGRDEDADIALLRVTSSLVESPPLGESTAVEAGDWVLAVGEPYGLTRSVSAGVVGGHDRHFTESAELVFIQSDVSLHPGNSGGPLLDRTGAIVAMNARTVVSAFGDAGISMSVPVEIVQQIADELLTQGTVKRPRLGAEFDDLPPAVAIELGRSTGTGALVVSIDPGGIAHRLGLRTGDVLVGMNGSAIERGADLSRILLTWRGRVTTKLNVWRDRVLLELRDRADGVPR